LHKKSRDVAHAHPALICGVDNDQKTGWVGIGSISDLSRVPTGEVRFGGDLFKLAENNSKPSAIRLSSRLDGPLAYPESAVIPVNHRADSLIFLQTCCWTEVRGKNIGSYCVVYEDGTSKEIQLSYGGNAMAWVDLNKSPNSVEAWTGKTKADERVSLRKMEWRNPSPEKRISRIEFKSAYTEAGPVLLAVSGIGAE
jgi:hypothetical protein